MVELTRVSQRPADPGGSSSLQVPNTKALRFSFHVASRYRQDAEGQLLVIFPLLFLYQFMQLPAHTVLAA